MLGDYHKRKSFISWLTVGTLLLLCSILGGLQYRWAGELSLADRDRMRGSLHASLIRLGADLSTELSNAAASLAPPPGSRLESGVEATYERRFAQWLDSPRHAPLFRAIGLAQFKGDDLTLELIDFQTGRFGPAEWPAGWATVKNRLTRRAEAERRGQRLNEPPPMDGLVFEVRYFAPIPQGPLPANSHPPRPLWLLLEVDQGYIASSVIPELLQRHLGAEGSREFHVEVLTRSKPTQLIYSSDGGAVPHLKVADASARILDMQYDRILRREPSKPPRERVEDSDWARWVLRLQHNSGSLETVVARTRWKNLAVTGGILLLMIATVGALILFTQRAQHLAQMQMEFIAGVSHELRTPLTVIRTAAYNLRGKVANNPAHVERYGALIQQETGRLTELVESVLLFAGSQAGQMIRSREPVSPKEVIDQAVQASKMTLDRFRCRVETHIDSPLPQVLGDPVALRHAVMNLISNAAKYGTEGNDRIDIYAKQDEDEAGRFVSIRVTDHGPGIPPDEQDQIFEPFFRGNRAIRDQIQGTGLGLSLVKGIVEAHDGTVQMVSRPEQGATFILRIPEAPAEQQDEFKDTAD